MMNEPQTSDSSSVTLLVLPSDFLGCDAEALRQELLSALVRARPIELDGQAVTRAGTASLQLLVAFFREAAQREVPARLRTPSRALLDAMHVLGLDGYPEVARALA